MISLEIVPLAIMIQESMLLSTGVRHGERRNKFMNDLAVYGPEELKEDDAGYLEK